MTGLPLEKVSKFRIAVDAAQVMIGLGSFLFLMGFASIRGSISAYHVMGDYSDLGVPQLMVEGFMVIVLALISYPLLAIPLVLIGIISFIGLAHSTKPYLVPKIIGMLLLLVVSSFLLAGYTTHEMAKTNLNNMNASYSGYKREPTNVYVHVIHSAGSDSRNVSTFGYRLRSTSEYLPLYTREGTIHIPHDRIILIRNIEYSDSLKSDSY